MDKIALSIRRGFWRAGLYFWYAASGTISRANSGQAAVTAVAAGVLGYWGYKVTPGPGWEGPVAHAFVAFVVAWLIIFLVRLIVAPWRVWKAGKWYGKRFVYDTPQLAYTAFIGPADNNKPHLFRFPDAPPNGFIYWIFEVDFNALTNVDVRCRSKQLMSYREPSGQQPQGGGFRLNNRRDMCMTTFLRADATPRTVRIFVTGWEIDI